MALTDRVINLDDASGSPLDISALIVGGMGDATGRDLAVQDLTGPAVARARKKQTGFVMNKSFTLTLEMTAAVKTAFYDGAETSNPRTFSLLWITGDSYAVECNITSAQPKTEPGENGILLLELGLDPTGSETIV